VKQACGQRIGDAARAQFRSSFGRRGTPWDPKRHGRAQRSRAGWRRESADDLMGDGINSPRWLGETAEPSTTRLSEEARRQLRLSLARRACRIKFNRSQNPRRM